MNVAISLKMRYESLYNEYIMSVYPFLKDKIRFIKYKHVFSYSDEKLLNYIANLMEDKYLDKDPDFEYYHYVQEEDNYSSLRNYL